MCRREQEQDRLARQWVQGMLESMESVEAMDEAVFQLAAVEQGCLVKVRLPFFFLFHTIIRYRRRRVTDSLRAFRVIYSRDSREAQRGAGLALGG